MIHTNECPLCGKVLTLKKVSGVTVLSCPVGERAHYEVESDAKETIQHFYAFPYAVDNFNNSPRSRVHLWNGSRWTFLREVPRIEPRPTDLLLGHLERVISHDRGSE